MSWVEIWKSKKKRQINTGVFKFKLFEDLDGTRKEWKEEFDFSKDSARWKTIDWMIVKVARFWTLFTTFWLS